MPPSLALSAFVPSRLLSLLARDPAPLPYPPWEERFTAAVMFLDVSGFTVLSEMLSRAGSSGTERLTDILNTSYQWLVAGVDGAGGFVARFDGDAIMAVFPGEGDVACFREAVHCGIELIRTAWRLPPEQVEGRDFILRLKVGVSVGPIYAAAVGPEDGELRYFVAGHAVEEAANASAQAGPMELLVPSRLQTLLPGDVSTLDAPSGHKSVLQAVLRRSTTPRALRRSELMMPPDAPSVDRVSRFVPAAIHERLRLGLSELVAEHRPVTILFGRFENYQGESPESAAALQRFAAEAFQCIVSHGGTIDKIAQADKGDVIMALFGAPSALEAPEAAASQCALALRQRFRPGDGLYLSRIGINCGHVYAGGLGAPWRHDYTVMGDAVNVASRLMSAAGEGEILITKRLFDRLHGWGFGPTRKLTLKGKAEPVEVWPLEAPPDLSARDSSEVELTAPGELLVGREREVARLDAAVERLRQGQSTFLVVEGEAGMGKTHMAAYVEARVLHFGRVLNRAVGLEGGGPYRLWTAPLAELLGGPGPTLDGKVRELLETELPECTPWLSLLNPILFTHFPSSPQVEAAEPRARELRLQDLVVGLVVLLAGRTPLLLVFDDYQASDRASHSLLLRLRERMEEAALLVVVVGLPSQPLEELCEHPAVWRVSMGPLERPALERLVVTLSGYAVAPSLLELIWQKSQGNPFFAEELLHALTRSGSVRTTAGRLEPVSESSLEVPDSLRAILQSRLDALPEGMRAVAKVAAVIGGRFSLPMVASLYREGEDTAFVMQQLEALSEAKVITPLPGAGEPTWDFRHVLSREVIYATMTRQQQVDLHRRIGLWLEANGVAIAPAILASHLEKGHDYARAVRYHLQAAAHAFDTFANQEALHGYERVITLADEHWVQLPGGVTRAQLMEAQGDVFFRVGDYQKAEMLFRRVRSIAPDWLSVVRSLRKEGEARLRADDLANALRCFGEALLLLKAERGFSLLGVGVPILLRLARDWFLGPPRKAGDPLPELERARYIELDQVYAVLGVAHYYGGRPDALEVIFRMAEVSRRLGEPGRIARAFSAIAFLYASLNLHRLARRYINAAVRWLELEADDVSRVRLRGTITYALSGAAARLGASWELSQALQEKGVALNRTVGDIWEEGLGLMNLALMWHVRGYHLRAREFHARILASCKPGEPFLYRGEALACDGLVLAELGRLDEARDQLQTALELPRLHALSLVRALAFRGYLAWLEGDEALARQLLEEANHMVRGLKMVGEHAGEVILKRLEVMIDLGLSGFKLRMERLRASALCRRTPHLAGSLELITGLLYLRQGKRRAALRSLSRAVERCLAVDAGREAARALAWKAHLLPEEADGLLRQARQLVEPRGLTLHMPGFPGWKRPQQ